MFLDPSVLTPQSRLLQSLVASPVTTKTHEVCTKLTLNLNRIVTVRQHLLDTTERDCLLLTPLMYAVGAVPLQFAIIANPERSISRLTLIS